MEINYKELAEYLKESQKIEVSTMDIMRVERLCIEKKLEPSERLVAYSVAAVKRFNIPADQAIDLASKSLGLSLVTFVDSLMSEGYREWVPVVREAAHALRSRLMQEFGRELINPTLTDEERNQFNSIPLELQSRYQVARLKSAEIPRSQLTLDEALEQIGNELEGSSDYQLPGN
jgi:hypothetical protein